MATELLQKVWRKKQPPPRRPWTTLDYCVEIEQFQGLIWKDKISNSPRLAVFSHWLQAQLARSRDYSNDQTG